MQPEQSLWKGIKSVGVWYTWKCVLFTGREGKKKQQKKSLPAYVPVPLAVVQSVSTAAFSLVRRTGPVGWVFPLWTAISASVQENVFKVILTPNIV